MARKASRKSAARPTSRGSKSERERIIEAFMALLAEKPIERIDFAEIAKSAHVSLSDLRGIFASTLAILAAQMREIDRAVLAGGDAELTDEPPRERLFDVLMRRLEVLAPHKAAVRSLMRSASRSFFGNANWSFLIMPLMQILFIQRNDSAHPCSMSSMFVNGHDSFRSMEATQELPLSVVLVRR